MGRYYFDHSENGRHYPDARGCECADEADARAVATQRVRRSIHKRLRDGSMPLGGYVAIRLGCGERVMFVPYYEATAG